VIGKMIKSMVKEFLPMAKAILMKAISKTGKGTARLSIPLKAGIYIKGDF